jgi:hypothetical protein
VTKQCFSFQTTFVKSFFETKYFTKVSEWKIRKERGILLIFPNFQENSATNGRMDGADWADGNGFF